MLLLGSATVFLVVPHGFNLFLSGSILKSPVMASGFCVDEGYPRKWFFRAPGDEVQGCVNRPTLESDGEFTERTKMHVFETHMQTFTRLRKTSHLKTYLVWTEIKLLTFSSAIWWKVNLRKSALPWPRCWEWDSQMFMKNKHLKNARFQFFKV